LPLLLPPSGTSRDRWRRPGRTTRSAVGPWGRRAASTKRVRAGAGRSWTLLTCYGEERVALGRRVFMAARSRSARGGTGGGSPSRGRTLLGELHAPRRAAPEQKPRAGGGRLAGRPGGGGLGRTAGVACVRVTTSGSAPCLDLRSSADETSVKRCSRYSRVALEP